MENQNDALIVTVTIGRGNCLKTCGPTNHLCMSEAEFIVVLHNALKEAMEHALHKKSWYFLSFVSKMDSVKFTDNPPGRRPGFVELYLESGFCQIDYGDHKKIEMSFKNFFQEVDLHFARKPEIHCCSFLEDHSAFRKTWDQVLNLLPQEIVAKTV